MRNVLACGAVCVFLFAAPSVCSGAAKKESARVTDGMKHPLQRYIQANIKANDGFYLAEGRDGQVWMGRFKRILSRAVRRNSASQYVLRAAFLQLAEDGSVSKDDWLLIDFDLVGSGGAWRVAGEHIYKAGKRELFSYASDGRRVPEKTRAGRRTLVVGGGSPAAMDEHSADEESEEREPSGILLNAVGSADQVDPFDCPGKRCLLAYLAPWCPACKNVTPMLMELKPWLEERDITFHIVVGAANAASCADFASQFGPDTLLDAGKQMTVNKYPTFMVIDAKGKVIKEPGTPGVLETPMDDAELRSLAAHFGLSSKK
ncbi:MAG: thioredoxin domain-containing protein [Elusimicrobiota bacterium]